MERCPKCKKEFKRLLAVSMVDNKTMMSTHGNSIENKQERVDFQK